MVSAPRSGEAMNGRAIVMPSLSSGLDSRPKPVRTTPGCAQLVQQMISALVAAGIEGGYLANRRLAKVHWQAGERPLPVPKMSVAGESSLWVDPAEIPSATEVAELGQAVAEGRYGDRGELMANTGGLHRHAVG